MADCSECWIHESINNTNEIGMLNTLKLTADQKTKLKSAWHNHADSLDCMAAMRVYDPCSKWECYIYAMNPEDEDEIQCIINGFVVEVTHWRISEIQNVFNSEGDGVLVDHEYRPVLANQLIKTLSERKS